MLLLLTALIPTIDHAAKKGGDLPLLFCMETSFTKKRRIFKAGQYPLPAEEIWPKRNGIEKNDSKTVEQQNCNVPVVYNDLRIPAGGNPS